MQYSFTHRKNDYRMVDCKEDRIQTEKLRNYIFSVEYTVIKFLHSYTFGCKSC